MVPKIKEMMTFRQYYTKTSQELQMLSSVTLNCQGRSYCHEFRFSIVRIVITSVSQMSQVSRIVFVIVFVTAIGLVSSQKLKQINIFVDIC